LLDGLEIHSRSATMFGRQKISLLLGVSLILLGPLAATASAEETIAFDPSQPAHLEIEVFVGDRSAGSVALAAIRSITRGGMGWKVKGIGGREFECSRLNLRDQRPSPAFQAFTLSPRYAAAQLERAGAAVVEAHEADGPRSARSTSRKGGTRAAPSAPRASGYSLELPWEDTPTLKAVIGRDLTYLAAQGRLDPVIGRKTEIERVLQVLARRTKNNPALVGEPGVGKSAISEGVAQQIVFGQAPERLLGRRVLELDLMKLRGGTSHRGELEEKIGKLLDEVRAHREEIVLVLDELGLLVGGSSRDEVTQLVANALKPALARGEFPTIGNVTLDEYRQYIERDGALSRRFKDVPVKPPSVKETIQILAGLKHKYEEHHGVTFTRGALRAAARLTDRYLPARALPDKAIDVIDEAGSRKAARAVGAGGRRVGERDVEQIVEAMTGIPVGRAGRDDGKRMLGLAGRIKAHVVAQDDSIDPIADAIIRSRQGLGDANRPIGSFLLLGPSGTGKTLTAKRLAYELFGDESAVVRFDLSEFMEKHTVARFVGAPPGYVDSGSGGKLGNAVRARPYCVVLLDEADKAHPDVMNTLLQVLDDGRLTDDLGTADFRNTVIIMTSNFGSEHVVAGTAQAAHIGFGREQEPAAEASKQKVVEKVQGLLKQKYGAPFVGRFDEVLVYSSLRRKDMKPILDLVLAETRLKLKARRLSLKVSPAAEERLIDRGFDPDTGARPLKRIVRKQIETPIARELAAKAYEGGGTVEVGLMGEGFAVHFRPAEPGAKRGSSRPAAGRRAAGPAGKAVARR
jgi:ATP-dependent Clp protease ATP-binding subunit ClpC